jgi:acetyl-CoA carboxylase biotin carboxyl carrier protein
VKLEEIQKLMAALEQSRLKKMIFKQGDMELHLEKEDMLCAPVRTHLVEAHPAAPIPAKETRAASAHGKFVTSPMVGTFYAAPSPDHPTFVKVGDTVQASTVVCIVEAMKVMNEVKAGISGVVAEVLVESGHPVEFGTQMIRIT